MDSKEFIELMSGEFYHELNASDRDHWHDVVQRIVDEFYVITDLEESLEDLERDIEQLESDNYELTREIDDLVTIIEDLREELEELQYMYNDLD